MQLQNQAYNFYNTFTNTYYKNSDNTFVKRNNYKCDVRSF